MIVWWSIERTSLNNIEYIVDNYNLTVESLNLLENTLSTSYNSQDIFANAIKIEYWSNKYWIEEWFEKWTIKSNMFLNKEELYNTFRKLRLSNLNGEWYYYKNIPKNYFKREFIYRMFASMSSISSQWYTEDIENINIESKKILEKIELKSE